MEPVPETERMEEFRSSPIPSLRLQFLSALDSQELDSPLKPPTLRRSTEPAMSSPTSPSWGPSSSLPYRSRTSSPLAGSHYRSRSTASLAPPMARTQSMPGVNGSGHLQFSPKLRPQSPSPSGSPSRVRVPRKPADEAFPSSPTRVSVHDPERRQPERNISPNLGLPGASLINRRRPSSPLRHIVNAGVGPIVNPPTTPSLNASSPSHRSYESVHNSYAAASSYHSSSVPSTPTSARSRSPSISSLETIPDSPDAEEAALEDERIAQLKAAADEADGGEGKSKSGLDVPTRGRTLGFGSRDKRKRWSVCGAERRGDLDLETIWED